MSVRGFARYGGWRGDFLLKFPNFVTFYGQ